MSINKNPSQVVKIMVAIPSMGYPPAEAYCNRLANFMHLGRLEEQGRWLQKSIQTFNKVCPEKLEECIKGLLEGEKLYHIAEDGKRFEFYFAVIGRIFTPVARDKACQMALQNDCDYVFMIDDDMICPDDMFQKLYKHNVDIVAALAFTRNFPHKPVMYSQLSGFDPVARKEYMQNYVIQNYPKNKLVECDAVGFGAVLIKTWVLRKLKEMSNNSDKWFMSTCGTGEDIYFCYQAKKVGARVFMDTATKIGHLGPPINVDEEYAEKIRLEKVPDFYKLHPLYDKYESKNGHREAVFVCGD